MRTRRAHPPPIPLSFREGAGEGWGRAVVPNPSPHWGKPSGGGKEIGSRAGVVPNSSPHPPYGGWGEGEEKVVAVSKREYCEHSDETVKLRGLRNMARYALGRYGLLGTMARFLLMRAEASRFVASGAGGLDKAHARRLLKAFNRIQAKVQCAHSPHQFVLIAKGILELDVPGAIVECGCYKGGSSAKLSILAKMTNRRLYVCDSFAGLPPPQSSAEARLEGYGYNPGYVYAEGEYLASLEEARQNVASTGCLEVCTFVPGFFKDSLPGLDVQAACVVVDADLISSARDCLKYLWPRTVEGGLWFTHEAALPGYVEGILDPDWWQATLGEHPPVIFGAGSGLSECANSLAYFRKRRAVHEGPGRQ